jgi:predicted nucleic acid-binding protein
MPETYVLDCSLAAKWILPEPDRALALRLFDRYASGEIALIAPDLLLAEFASVLAKRRRRKQISAEQAVEAFRWMTRCTPKLYDTRPRLGNALQLSLQFQMSLWDCVYVALAMEHDCAFLTADRRLFRSGGARHPSLQLIHGKG